jgi:hypothetical protein
VRKAASNPFTAKNAKDAKEFDFISFAISATFAVQFWLFQIRLIAVFV